MTYKSIIYEKQGSIGRLILNRPEAGNTLNLDLAKELFDVLNAANADKDLKALILTGKGKLFCGGGDLNFLIEKKDNVKETLLMMTHYFHGAISRIANLSAPVITGINGTAGGGGFSLAITGDIIISVSTAKFTLAYTNAGLSPDGSSTYYLPRIIGLKKAKELMLTNRVFSAEEALKMELIDKVVENQQQLEDELTKQAETFAKGPNQAYASVKKLLNMSFSNGLETQMEAEGLHIANNAQSNNGNEGMLAFKEKRSPNFK
ncbi:MAG: enoyl-CoA hydratase [Rickettsiales bacterium]|nr:enoyl-CoA hydratase [Rickettsiales bacterium]